MAEKMLEVLRDHSGRYPTCLEMHLPHVFMYSALRESQRLYPENADVWTIGSNDAHRRRLLHEEGK